MRENLSMNLDTNNLVSVQDHRAVTTSLQVAEYFGKEHRNVLKAIRELDCSERFTELNFEPCFYTSELRNGVKKQLPMYYMTRDGFTFLAMGFTGKVAASFKEAYIEAFNRMEAELRQEETTAVASRLLDDYVARFNERMRQSIESGRRRNGRAYGPVGEIIGHLPIRPDLPFDEKLRTLFAYVNNSCLDSFYHVSQERALRQELEDMRAMCQGFVERFEGRFGAINNI